MMHYETGIIIISHHLDRDISIYDEGWMSLTRPILVCLSQMSHCHVVVVCAKHAKCKGKEVREGRPSQTSPGPHCIKCKCMHDKYKIQ